MGDELPGRSVAREQSSDPRHRSPRVGSPKLWLGLALFTAIGLSAWYLRERLSFAQLAAQENRWRATTSEAPVASLAAALVAYVAVTALSLPGAAAMTLLYGWLFGFWRALLVVSFASTLGATLAFLSSRYLLRDWVRGKFHDRLRPFEEAFERDGALYLFGLRLVPAVPFVLVNLLMGLTPVGVRTFAWVSQLGMLPGTAVYVYAGATLPSLQQGPGRILSLPLVLAFTALGLFPVVARRMLGPWLARVAERRRGVLSGRSPDQDRPTRP